jgi:uroporphyrinogen decarboxylase
VSGAMTAAARLAAALQHREADRVPFFLPVTMHGALLLGVPLSAYMGNADLATRGQLRLLELLGHDAVTCFLCAAGEVEPFGGEVLLHDDGPPNAGEPPLRSAADIERLEPPQPQDSPMLRRSLDVAWSLRQRLGPDVPVLGGAVAPFSLPAMQLGLGLWFDLLHDAPGPVDHLLQVNEAFCVAWANALLEAGAGAIVLAEPLASSLMVPRASYLARGLPVLRRAIAAIRGPVAVSTVSAPCASVALDLAGAGAVGVGISAEDDLAAVKRCLRGRAAVMGNLSGLRMRTWSAADAEREVRAALAGGGPGGGFVLSEHHGEIPLQVPLEVLEAAAEAVRRWGRYPLTWSADAR